MKEIIIPTRAQLEARGAAYRAKQEADYVATRAMVKDWLKLGYCPVCGKTHAGRHPFR